MKHYISPDDPLSAPSEGVRFGRVVAWLAAVAALLIVVFALSASSCVERAAAGPFGPPTYPPVGSTTPTPFPGDDGGPK